MSKISHKSIKACWGNAVVCKTFLSEIFVQSDKYLFIGEQVKKTIRKKSVGAYTYILLPSNTV